MDVIGSITSFSPAFVCAGVGENGRGVNIKTKAEKDRYRLPLAVWNEFNFRRFGSRYLKHNIFTFQLPMNW